MKLILRFSIGLVFTLTCISLAAQGNKEWEEPPTITLSGFLDLYYVYDFNQPQDNYRQPFFYNYNRHNELNLNTGFVKLAANNQKYTTNFALHTGTYANDNYAAEPGLLKNILEANIGISLNSKNNIWLEVGIFPSPIGFESAASLDNWNLTRSLVAENSPYFLSGAKLTYSSNEKLKLMGLIANGWQRIQRLPGNAMPSFCGQAFYSSGKKWNYNWSTFIGTDDPDSTRRIRYFNNFYTQVMFTEKLGLIMGFDIGLQQRAKASSDYETWSGYVAIAQLSFHKTWKTAIRIEYYQDEHGVIIPTETKNGFKTSGLSWNIDYQPINTLSCRLECRWLNSQDEVFKTKAATTRNNFFIGTLIGIRFQESINQ